MIWLKVEKATEIDEKQPQKEYREGEREVIVGRRQGEKEGKKIEGRVVRELAKTDKKTEGRGSRDERKRGAGGASEGGGESWAGAPEPGPGRPGSVTSHWRTAAGIWGTGVRGIRAVQEA